MGLARSRITFRGPAAVPREIRKGAGLHEDGPVSFEARGGAVARRGLRGIPAAA